MATAEGLINTPPNCSEVGAPQIELNGTVGEARIKQPVHQYVLTKLIFEVVFDNQILD